MLNRLARWFLIGILVAFALAGVVTRTGLVKTGGAVAVTMLAAFAIISLAYVREKRKKARLLVEEVQDDLVRAARAELAQGKISGDEFAQVEDDFGTRDEAAEAGKPGEADEPTSPLRP